MMSREQLSRSELLRTLNEELRNVSALSVLFSQAVADRLGMNSTDLECLDILSRTGPVTAGRLAELTSLTTGAITGLVDRLEKAGYVRRDPDPHDRRRVIIVPLPLPGQEAQRMELLFGPLARSVEQLSSRFSDRDLALVLEFIAGANALVREETVRLRGESNSKEVGVDFSSPLGTTTSGHLSFSIGVASVSIHGDPVLTDLFRAHFEPPTPNVNVQDGRITIRYSRWPRLRWRGKTAADIALNTSIPWQIDIHGGASNVTADLAQVRLGQLEIHGGANKVMGVLSSPSGTVPIRIHSGVSNVTLLRPAGVPVRAQIYNGASHVTLDEQYFGAIGGQTRWQSPDYDDARDRYDFEIHGGASKLTIASR